MQKINEFIKNNPNYELIDQHIILPQDKGFDGFYMAKLRKGV